MVCLVDSSFLSFHSLSFACYMFSCCSSYKSAQSFPSECKSVEWIEMECQMWPSDWLATLAKQQQIMGANVGRTEAHAQVDLMKSMLQTRVLRDWTDTESGERELMFSSSANRVSVSKAGVVTCTCNGSTVEQSDFVAQVKLLPPLPGFEVDKSCASFIIRLESESEEVGADRSVVELRCSDLLHHLEHSKTAMPVLRKALETAGCDRVESKGGSVKFRDVQLGEEWNEFKKNVKHELEQNEGECAMELQRVIQQSRFAALQAGERSNEGRKEERAPLKLKPKLSVLLMAGNAETSWKKTGSQHAAAPVDQNVFVTLYRLEKGANLEAAVRDARLLSKELKEHGVQFRNSQCHRLMSVSKSFPLDLHRVIRQSGSRAAEDAKRSVQETRWAKSMQGMLVDSMRVFSKNVFATADDGLISSSSEEDVLFVLFTWDHSFHMICEQAVANKRSLRLQELEYSFYRASIV